MKRALGVGLSVLVGLVVLLAAAFLLLFATLDADGIADPSMRRVGLAAALVFGVIVLLAALRLATRLAVRLHAGDSAEPRA